MPYALSSTALCRSHRAQLRSPDPRGTTAEYHIFDELEEALGTAEFRKLPQDAFLSHTVSVLVTREPIRLAETAGVASALDAMLAQDQVAVVVVDEAGRLSGIATDLGTSFKRAADRDPGRLSTRSEPRMTPDPEALEASDRDRICPCGEPNDGDGLPRCAPPSTRIAIRVGIVTVGDIAKWLAAPFPEAILNLRPQTRPEQPTARDGGLARSLRPSSYLRSRPDTRRGSRRSGSGTAHARGGGRPAARRRVSC